MKKINFTLKSFLIMSLFILGCNKEAEEPIYLNPESGISFLDIENDGYEVTLAAQLAPDDQTGTWRIYHGEYGRFDNINDPKSKFYGEPGETYQLGWELSQGKEYESDVITVSFKEMLAVLEMFPKDTIHNNVSLHLKAEAPKFGSTGSWTITNGENARIENQENHYAEFIGEKYKDYTVRWTLIYGSKQKYIEYSFITDEFQAYAGEDNLDIRTERDADKFYNLDAFLPAGANGEWNLLEGEGGSVYNTENPNSLFEGNPDEEYKLTWKVNLDNKESIDTLSIRFRGKWGMWTDSRDNQSYKTTEINSLEWMSENYNYAVNSGNGSWYYGNAERSVILDGVVVDTKEDRKKYGRLYDWNTAMEFAPEGWRLPTALEYESLENYLGGEFYAGHKIKKGGETGIDLDFNGYLNIVNSSDPALRNTFQGQSEIGIFWLSDYASNSGFATAKITYRSSEYINNTFLYSLGYGASVRYVRDIQ